MYDVVAEMIDGSSRALSDYRGQVALVVNVASRCGYTPQYRDLEALYRKYSNQGLAVLGFPCNQFGGQEPGSAEQISRFCKDTYDVTFPMFAPVEVNGPNTHPVFAWLKESCPGILGSRRIKWNFTKFLVSRNGLALARYASRYTVAKIEPDVVAALEDSGPVP